MHATLSRQSVTISEKVVRRLMKQERVYQGGVSVGAFFDRTFNAPDRFGKVVYLYGDAH